MDKEWECEECGYVHLGERPPRRCPECEAWNSFFLLFGEGEEVEEEEEEEDEDW